MSKPNPNPKPRYKVKKLKRLKWHNIVRNVWNGNAVHKNKFGHVSNIYVGVQKGK